MFLKAKIISVAIPLMLIGCASTPNLSQTSPEGIDLSGEWLVNSSISQTVVLGARDSQEKGSKSGRGKGGKGGKGERGGRGERGERGEGQAKSKSKEGRRSRGVATMVAAEMKIDQDNLGLGIAFPKKPYRDIDWGEHEFRNTKVTAGWNEDDQLIVISKSDRHSFTETFMLNDTGDELTILFDVQGPSGAKQYVRVFDRKIVE